MNLSELISKYGDDKVEFQKLDDCVANFNRNKHGSKVTFVTSEDWGIDGFNKMGLIVWLDRKRIASIIADAALPVSKARGES